MNTSIFSWRSPVQKFSLIARSIFGFAPISNQKKQRNRSRVVAYLESLEDRSVPAVLYGALQSSYTITTDNTPAGFSKGDVVTWNGPTPVTGLVVGTNAFVGVADAIAAAAAADTVNLAANVYTNGNISVPTNNLTVNAPTGASGFSLELGNKAISTLNLTGSANIDLKGNQYNNILVGNSGNNLLNAEHNVADILKADPATAVSIPTTATGTAVTSMSPGRLESGGFQYYVFRLRNGNTSPVNVTASTQSGALIFSGSLPAMTDTFVAAKTNSSFGAVTLVGSGISGFPKASSTAVGNFSYDSGNDDNLTGGGGNDTLRGGIGTDTAVFSGKRAEYSITVSGNTATVKDNRPGSPDGTDMLVDMEKIQFSDGTFRVLPSSFQISAGSSANLVLANNTVFNTSASLSVFLSLDGKTSDGTLTAVSETGIAVSGSGTNTLTITGAQSALNTYLSTAGKVKYSALTSASRVMTFSTSDGFNLSGFTNLAGGAAPSFTSANNSTTTYGTSLNFSVLATGTPAPTFSITTGSLPSGIKLDATTGVLSGITGAGTYNFTITASNATSSATQPFTLTVNKAALTITADSKSKTYGANDPALTFTVAGLVNGDTSSVFTGAISRTSGEKVGTYAIGQNTLSAGANYSVTYVEGKLTIDKATLNVIATGSSKAYDGKTTAMITLSDNRKSGDAIIVTSASANFSDSKPGNGKTITVTGLTLSGADSGNYSLASTTISTTANISKAALTITADNKGKSVNAPNPVLTASYVGLVDGETSSVVSGLAIATTAVLKSPPGSYPITLSGATALNYNITLVNGTLKVGTAPLITSANKTSFTYGKEQSFQVVVTGSSNINLSITSGKLPNGLIFDPKTGVISGTPLSNSIGVTTFTITASNGIPNDASQVFNLTVNKASLNIKATNATKVYGQTLVLSNYVVTGLVGTDTVNSVLLSSFGTALTTPVGTYSIFPSAAVGTNLGNYSISYTNGSLAVNKAALTIKANDTSKTYGTLLNLVQTAFSTTGLVNSDKLTGLKLTSLGTPVQAAVGKYDIVPSGATGGSLANYTIIYVNGSLSVNKAALTVTPNSRQKTQGSTIFFTGTEFSVNGLKNSDQLTTLTLESKGTPGETETGNYPVTAADPKGAGLENYEIKILEGNITVVKPEDFSGILGNGTFTTDASGKISIDFLFDGGGYVGQMGFYSLVGMTDLKPGSEEYIKEAARRVLTGSGEGQVLISDITDGARSSAKLLTDSLFNKGKYLGVQDFQMDGNAKYGVILVPNGTFSEIFAKPSLTGAKRPLFSHNLANPSMTFNEGAQLSDLTGESSVFAWEDTRLDDVTLDRDYNDIIFRILGAKGEAFDYKSVVAPLEDITKDPSFGEIIA